jgi:hypothetical protein
MTFEPGIHDGVAAAVYHAAPGVSKSQLDRMTQSPAHFRASIDGEREPATPAMEIGTLTHLAVFQPELFGDGISHWVRPEGMSFVTKEGKAWKAAHSDKIILDGEGNIRGMKAAIQNHPMAATILKSGLAEQSLFAIDPETGVLKKGRLDWLTEDSDGRPVIVDLKTTDDATEWTRKAAGFRYHVQNAYYVDLLENLGIHDAFFLFIVVEKSAPYGVRVVQFSPDSVETGRALYKRELSRYAECTATGTWPCYSTEIETVYLPKWAMATV